MELRFQHFLLSLSLSCVCSLAFGAGKLDVNNEYFELSASTGLVAIQDFNTEPSVGIAATFNASENFFLQTNLLAAEATKSAYEKFRPPYFPDDSRTFVHYDLLLGYNVFQGEVFRGDAKAQLSTLYIVFGAGNTSFGGENSFTTVWGFGYKFGLTRKINFRVDFRDYAFKSTRNDIIQATHNTHFTAGLGYLF